MATAEDHMSTRPSPAEGTGTSDMADTSDGVDVVSGESRQSHKLKRLIRANQHLATIESLDELFGELLDIAQDVCEAEASSILLYSKKRDCLTFARAKNDITGEVTPELLKKNVVLRPGEGLAGWVARERRSLNVADVRSDARFTEKADKTTGFTTRCILTVPILHMDELQGVIQVLNAKHKPHFDDDDRELLESFANLASVALVRSRLLAERLAQQRLHTQLETAASIQHHFRPTLPERLYAEPQHDPQGRGIERVSRIWAYSEPAAFVGGDLYDCIPLPDHSYVVYVADVAGKGLPAALVMTALWSRLRAEVFSSGEVEVILTNVNRAMFEVLANQLFVTIVLGRYWPHSGRLQFSLAGHSPPLWVTPAGIRTPPIVKGMPLGILEQTRFERAEITLQAGESMVMTTDGVSEARNLAGDFYGDDGAEATLSGCSVHPCGRRLVDGVRRFRGDAEASDDLTVLEIWRES